MGIARFCLLTVLVVSCVEAKRLKLADKEVDSAVKASILNADNHAVNIFAYHHFLLQMLVILFFLGFKFHW